MQTKAGKILSMTSPVEFVHQTLIGHLVKFRTTGRISWDEEIVDVCRKKKGRWGSAAFEWGGENHAHSWSDTEG